jgi:hypothetical protein
VSADVGLGSRTDRAGPSAQPQSRYPDSPHHHGSHRDLVTPETVQPGRGAAVSAVVVPTVRPAAGLRHAAALAWDLNCWLVVLCSGRSRPAEVVDALDGERCPRLLTVDVPRGHQHPLVKLSTSEVHGRQSQRRVDTAHKRNLGLLLAHIIDWPRILFLDDDIAIEKPVDVRHAAGLLDRYDSVGLSIGGYPDNSVVCHAHRLGKGEQDTFVGGGALAVNVPRTRSFFPEIYNEDWFFLLDKLRLRPVAVTGQAVQQEYDPFAHPDRARYEEFGDVLAEGVFWLLDQHRRVKDATEPFWSWFLDQRAAFIADVTGRIRTRDLDEALRRRVLAALQAAQDQRGRIPAALCAEYLRAWSADRTRWQNVVAALPIKRDPVAAGRLLGLRCRTRGSRRRVIQSPWQPAGAGAASRQLEWAASAQPATAPALAAR